jgi:glyoxylase I family protein
VEPSADFPPQKLIYSVGELPELRNRNMKKYNIEHVGIIVRRPMEMAQWYADVLGFDIRSSAGDDEKGGAFLTDADGRVMLEFGRLPDVTPLADRVDHHLQLHLGVHSDDPDAEAEYLVSKGAEYIEKCPASRPGDNLIVLRDPWGNCIQLVKRGPA